MFTLQKLNVVRIVATEQAKSRLITEGFVEVVETIVNDVKEDIKIDVKKNTKKGKE
jgi:hypothetical protein